MGLEELNILFSSIQLTGLLPHSIVLDKKTNTLQQFHCGWRYKSTWWFGIFALAQVIWMAIFSFENLITLKQNTESNTYFIVLCFRNLSYGIVRLCPIILVFYVERIKLVLKIFGAVDSALKNCAQLTPSTVKRRTIIGFTIGIIMVS